MFKFTKKSHNYSSTLEGDDVIMDCTASAVPAPLYSIFNTTSLVSKTSEGVFIIHNVSNALDDVYRCEASNSEGTGDIVYKELNVFGNSIFFAVWRVI